MIDYKKLQDALSKTPTSDPTLGDIFVGLFLCKLRSSMSDLGDELRKVSKTMRIPFPETVRLLLPSLEKAFELFIKTIEEELQVEEEHHRSMSEWAKMSKELGEIKAEIAREREEWQREREKWQEEDAAYKRETAELDRIISDLNEARRKAESSERPPRRRRHHNCKGRHNRDRK